MPGIVSASLWIGIQQMVGSVASLVQSKAIALWAGPSGMGLYSMYGALLAMAQLLCGLGIHGSAVREIAVLRAQSQWGHLGAVSKVVQELSIALATVGAAILAGGLALGWSVPVANQHVPQVAVSLGLALIFIQWSNGQHSVLMGLQRIPRVVTTKIVASLIGAAGGVALVAAFRDRGVAPAFAMSAWLTWGCYAWSLSRLRLKPEPIPPTQWRQVVSRLLKHGIGFFLPGLAHAVATVAVRALVITLAGVSVAGYYHVAWTITTLVGQVALQALFVDYYPRLCASASQAAARRKIVNDYTESWLLLSTAGVLPILVLLRLLIPLLFSPDFLVATALTQWMLVSVVVRTPGWVFSFLPLAAGQPSLAVVTEALSNVIWWGFTWIGMRYAGFEGVGVAHFAHSMLYTAGWLYLANRRYGTGWSARIGVIFALVLSLAASVVILDGGPWGLRHRGIAVPLALTLSSALAFWTLRLAKGAKEAR